MCCFSLLSTHLISSSTVLFCIVDDEEVVHLGKRKCREKSVMNYADADHDSGFNRLEVGGDGAWSDDDESDFGESASDNEYIASGVGSGATATSTSTRETRVNIISSSIDSDDKKTWCRTRVGPSHLKKKVIPAEWSVENVSKLAATLVDTGYGNWEKIRHRSRLPFPLHDIALCKSICVITLLSLF